MQTCIIDAMAALMVIVEETTMGVPASATARRRYIRIITWQALTPIAWASDRTCPMHSSHL